MTRFAGASRSRAARECSRANIDRSFVVPHTRRVSERLIFRSHTWRLLASFTVVIWVSAFALCTAHCSLPNGSFLEVEEGKSVLPCHGGPSCPKSEAQPSGAFCITIKNLFAADGAAPILYPPQAGVFTAPFLLLPVTDLFGVSPTLQRVREQDRVERPFTPEVCLGPAFRAHAPPVF